MSIMKRSDYLKILQYYKITPPKNNKTLKRKAENILATKLCRCIKRIGGKDESKAIGICTRSIFNKKGLTRGPFKCKKKTRRVAISKTRGSRSRTVKNRKGI